MRALSVIALVACAAQRPARVVPVRVVCAAIVSHGVGLVRSASLVETAAHVIECADGLPRQWVTAGGVPVSVESYDPVNDTATLRALEGAPWRGPNARVRRVRPGDSGSPLFDAAGRAVCSVRSVFDDVLSCRLYAPFERAPTVEYVPGPLTTSDLDAPAGPDAAWPTGGQ